MVPILPGELLRRLDIALKAQVRGWGPDVSEINLWCADDRCIWEYTYTEETTIGELIERVAAHEHQYARQGTRAGG